MTVGLRQSIQLKPRLCQAIFTDSAAELAYVDGEPEFSLTDGIGAAPDQATEAWEAPTYPTPTIDETWEPYDYDG